MLSALSKVSRSTWNRFLILGGCSLAIILATTSLPQYLIASDHDDGEVDTKGRNLNLTDLYAYREQDQTGTKSDDLVLTMNSNPRSIARQQYFFSTNARYEFKLTRVAKNSDKPTGKEDITLRFEFGAPEGLNQQQPIIFTAIKDGQQTTARGLSTTSLTSGTKVNELSNKVSVFAGLREDPFFFDVEQFFRVRAGALGIGPKVGFRDSSKAVDSFKGFNVNTIAIRIPKTFLQGKTSVNTFDIWETISLRDPRSGEYRQVERLARPAINEGLIVTNDFLNAFNSISPKEDFSQAAAPVRAEAVRTLKVLGNDDKRIAFLVDAFLPDVMRFDTTAPSGYGTLIGGRMLKEDVIDTTLNVLTSGGIPGKGITTGDNVSYEGTGSNPAQGHKPLEKSFPYLALPN